jgi:hypothetical protein
MPDTHVLNTVRSRVSAAACQAQVDAMAGGEMPMVVPEDMVARSVERRRIALAKRPTVEPHWPAMSRLLDRRDPGSRD